MRRKKKRDAETVATGGEGIPRRGATSAPLSFAQQRLWLLDQLEPESAAYNLAAPARLRGELDPAVLARCLTEIARRHESLRTTFDVHDGEPVQVIAPAAPFPLPLIDLTGLPADARAAAAFELARRDNATPFDLARGPLARAALLRLAADEHHLLFNMHHVVTDGWSYGLLFGELSRLYDAFVAGRPSPLPELPIQYADFAAWQREWLQGANLERQIAYWRQQLQGAAAALELPTDRQRPPLQTHRGEYATLSLPGDLVAALREFSRRERTTLFMVLLAGLEVVLHRWAGQDDLVVGSPSAGRGRIETEGLIGFFLNTLVLRTDLGGNPSFAGLLSRVRETVLGAYRYQDLPFERLLEELQVERQLSRSPLFQVLFNMITLPEIRLDLSGLRVEPLGAPEPQSKFDFTIYVNDSGGAVDCNLLYNADLFDGVRMEALLAEFLHVLRQGVAAPETPIEALSLVPPEMASRLPDPRRALPAAVWPGAVHQRLSLHAARSPEREMVADGRESWSYGELEARANQLAHRLRQAGVGREDVVAIYAQRNASLVWAVLGALKAGAAFLILDPAYPASRLVDYLEIGAPAAFLAVQDATAPTARPGAPRRRRGGARRPAAQAAPPSAVALGGRGGRFPCRPAGDAARGRGGGGRPRGGRLHLGLDGQAQGGARPARPARAVPALVGRALRLERGRPLRDALGALPRPLAARHPHPGVGGGEPGHPGPRADGGAGVADRLDRARGGQRPPPHPRHARAGGRRRDLPPAAAPAPRLRGRRPAAAQRGGTAATDRAAAPLRQPLRLDGDPALGRLLAGAAPRRGACRARGAAARGGDPRRRAAGAQRRRRPRRHRRGRRGLPAQPPPRPRLPRRRRADGAALPAQSLPPRGCGGPHLPHRRPRALRRGRRGGARRPGRPPGQDPRLPHRAGGDRGGAAPPPGGARVRGGGAGGRREAPGRLFGTSVGTRPERGGAGGAGPRAARLSRRPAPGVHDPRRLRLARRAADDQDRQGRPPGAPRAHADGGGRGGRAAAHAGRGADRRHLGRAAGPSRRDDRGRRQLLRARRPFAARDAGALPHARGAPRGGPSARAVRGADGRRARRGRLPAARREADRAAAARPRRPRPGG